MRAIIAIALAFLMLVALIRSEATLGLDEEVELLATERVLCRKSPSHDESDHSACSQGSTSNENVAKAQAAKPQSVAQVAQSTAHEAQSAAPVLQARAQQDATTDAAAAPQGKYGDQLEVEQHEVAQDLERTLSVDDDEEENETMVLGQHDSNDDDDEGEDNGDQGDMSVLADEEDIFLENTLSSAASDHATSLSTTDAHTQSAATQTFDGELSANEYL